MTLILGRKHGMTHVFREDGTLIGVTVVAAGPCTVTQVRTQEADGYHAIQLGFGDTTDKRTSQPLRGHFTKVGCAPKQFLREERLAAPPTVKTGDTISVTVFNPGDLVDVIGTTKGRGFSGVVKRHGFKGLRATHGVKRMHRHPGSSGPSADPARTQKGIRKPGQFGNARVTVQNLKVVRVDAQNNLLLVRGAVPGHNNAFVVIKQSRKA